MYILFCQLNVYPKVHINIHQEATFCVYPKWLHLIITKEEPYYTNTDFFLQFLILKLEGCVCDFHLWFAAMTTHCEGWYLHILFCSLTFITELILVTLLKFGGNEICGAMDWEAEVFWFNLQCGQTTGGVPIAGGGAKVQSVAQVLLSKVENPKCPHSLRGVPWIHLNTARIGFSTGPQMG